MTDISVKEDSVLQLLSRTQTHKHQTDRTAWTTEMVYKISAFSSTLNVSGSPSVRNANRVCGWHPGRGVVSTAAAVGRRQRNNCIPSSLCSVASAPQYSILRGYFRRPGINLSYLDTWTFAALTCDVQISCDGPRRFDDSIVCGGTLWPVAGELQRERYGTWSVRSPKRVAGLKTGRIIHTASKSITLICRTL